MTGRVVGLFYDHWTNAREAPNSLRNPVKLWKKAVWYRANPRSEDYMRKLLAEHFPAAAFVNVGSATGTSDALPGASKIVLLFPDSIGLGFSVIERDVARHGSSAAVDVLNGRRRRFAFDSRTRWALRYRRLLEWTMLVEFCIGAFIVVVTPFLFMFDFVRGRK